MRQNYSNAAELFPAVAEYAECGVPCARHRLFHFLFNTDHSLALERNRKEKKNIETGQI